MSSEELDTEALRSAIEQLQHQDLEPMSPPAAVEMYLDLRKSDVTDSTLRTHESRLSFFLTWCANQGIENMNHLSGRDIQRFRSWRRDQLASDASFESNMRTLSVFLTKCVKFDAVPPSLPDKVDIPSVDDNATARDDIVEPEYARNVLTHLEKFLYAQLEHVVWVLLAEAGLRISAIHSLDTTDYVRLDDGALLHLRHRSDLGTRLKNKTASERSVHISETTATIIDDYLDTVHTNVTDEHGRKPLVASKHGRLRKTTMRKYVYKWTRPCTITGTCPHGISADEFETCDARSSASQAYECPSSVSPHAVRRGYLTAELDAGVPKSVLADRCDVSEDVIDTSYDSRNEEAKMRLRKELRKDAYEESDRDAYGR